MSRYDPFQPSTLSNPFQPLRAGDFGILWEHLVLEHLQAHFPDTPVRYWRDKAGHEVDFILAHRRDEVDVVECKWDADAFDPAALKLFRISYPKGRNYLVTPSGDQDYTRFLFRFFSQLLDDQQITPILRFV